MPLNPDSPALSQSLY